HWSRFWCDLRLQEQMLPPWRASRFIKGTLPHLSIDFGERLLFETTNRLQEDRRKKICPAVSGLADSRLNDGEKIVGLEARSPHQRPIDVGLTEQRRRVVRLDAAPVLDDEHLRRRVAAQLADAFADEGVCILRLLRRRVDAGADGPDRLVGD